MKKDSGWWLVEGRVASDKQRRAVWKRYHAQLTRLYHKQIKLQRSLEKALLSIDKERASLLEPYTPWLGRRDEGVVPAFVERARAEYYRRLRSHKA